MHIEVRAYAKHGHVVCDRSYTTTPYTDYEVILVDKDEEVVLNDFIHYDNFNASIRPSMRRDAYLYAEKVAKIHSCRVLTKKYKRKVVESWVQV